MNPVIYQSPGDFAKAVRAGDAAKGPVRAVLAATVKAADSKRVLRFTISDQSVDRVGDTIAVAGWQLDNFKRNPVVLWSHNKDVLPVAKCVGIGVNGRALVADAQFAPAEVNPFAEQCYQAYLGGFLSAVSVGFWPTEYEIASDRDGINFIKQELWEFSAVTIPANANALIQPGKSAPPATQAAPPAAKKPNTLSLYMRQLATLRRR